MNRNKKVLNVVLAGVAAAAVFLMTYFVKIPMGYMFVNLGDAAIIIFSAFLTPTASFVSAAVGSTLADLALGYTMYAPITFVVKGLVGLIISAMSKKVNIEFSALIGEVIMIGGYFISELLIFPLFEEGFGLATAISSIPLNSLQAIAGILVGSIAVRILKKAGIKRI